MSGRIHILLTWERESLGQGIHASPQLYVDESRLVLPIFVSSRTAAHFLSGHLELVESADAGAVDSEDRGDGELFYLPAHGLDGA